MRSLVVVVLLSACGGSPKPAPAPPAVPAKEVSAKPVPPAPKTLFDRLGGMTAVTLVVDDFVNRTTVDDRIKERFFNTDAVNLKKLLVEFVCVAAGGPCTYTGRTMEDSHSGMGLVDEEFTALVEDLVAAMDKYKVPEKEKNEVLAALGPLKPTMVVGPDKLKPIDDAKLAQVTKVAAATKDKTAADLLAKAVIAGKRGQQSYAEQLFSRAELITGPKPLASLAPIFRAGAPARVTTALKKMPDTAPQPKVVGGSETDEPIKKPLAGSLSGTLTVDGKPAGFGVIMMWPTSGKFAKRTAKQRVIEQRGKEFAPHVMAVPVGSTISFPNFDTIFHNVFSLSKTKPFDLGLYKSGETREVKVDKPGIVRVGCNLHAQMSAYVIVVDAPAYVPTEPDGSFAFRSLAPGKYKVQAWNERSGEPLDTEIEIKPGQNQTKFDLKLGGQMVSPDKFNIARDVKPSK